MNKKFLIAFILLIFSIVVFSTPISVRADSLEDIINKEIEGVNLESLEDFYNSIVLDNSIDFNKLIDGYLNGTNSFNVEELLTLAKNIIFAELKSLLPVSISVIIIAIIFSLTEQLKGKYISNSVKSTISLACILAILLLLTKQIISAFTKVKIIIENIAKLSEIMSPIMLGLIVASGGKISASMYSPAVVFISNGFISIVSSVLFPLVALITVFSIIGLFSDKIKFSKFSEFFASIFKWVLGICVTVSGLFITVNGLNASVIDGVSIKAAKYAISNSVPMIGGFLKDGFDIVTAGTIIIKNVIGIVGVVILFYLLLSPVLYLISFSLIFKLTSAIVEPFTDGKISLICVTFSKTITYLIVCLLAVALMFFILILLLMITSSAFF